METYINIIGYFGAIFTTLATLPQFISIIRTKEVEGVSLSMFLILGAGFLLWFTYGLLKHDMPVTIANFFTLLIVVGNIIMIIKYQKKDLILN